MLKIMMMTVLTFMTSLNHPMSISISLIFLILLSFSILLKTNFILIPFMIIMLFIGGLMIMFVYFSSLLNSKLNKLKSKMINNLTLWIMIMWTFKCNWNQFNMTNLITYYSSNEMIILITFLILLIMTLLMKMISFKKITMKNF